MKKNLLFPIICLSIIAFCSIKNVTNKKTSEITNLLILENIEALAQTHGEYDGGLTRYYITDTKEMWFPNPVTGEPNSRPTIVNCCQPTSSPYSGCAVDFLGTC